MVSFGKQNITKFQPSPILINLLKAITATGWALALGLLDGLKQNIYFGLFFIDINTTLWQYIVSKAFFCTFK